MALSSGTQATIRIDEGNGAMFSHRCRVLTDGDDTWVSVVTNSPARDAIADGTANLASYTDTATNAGGGPVPFVHDRIYTSFDLSDVPSNARITSISVKFSRNGTPSTTVGDDSSKFRLVKSTAEASSANGATTCDAIDHTINNGEDIDFPAADGKGMLFDLDGTTLFDYVVAQHAAGNRANFYLLNKLAFDVFVDASATAPTGTNIHTFHGYQASLDIHKPTITINFSYVGGGTDYPVRYAKINGLSKADSDFFINGMKDIHVNGLRDPLEISPPPVVSGTPTTFLTKQSSWENSGGKTGYGAVPTGWQTNTTDTVYGSTTANRKWTSDTGGTTPSSGTGPTRGHDSSQDIDGDGREGASTDDYIYTEATSQFNKHFLLRTPELDLSSALANNTLKLYFWFHMYGSNMGNLGVAVTDNSTSAGDDTLGLHFTGDSTGGATIVYWDDNSDDGSSTASGVRISGQQQTAGHGSISVNAHWRLAYVDLNSVAGQSSVYIWFYGKTGANFRSDMAIDDVDVRGES